MKKKLSSVLVVSLAVSALLCGCQTGEKPKEESEKKQTIVVGTTDDYTKVGLEAAEETFEAMGYAMEIETFDDYTMPNTALVEESVDANFFQHKPYLNMYNENNGTDLVMIEPLIFNVPNTMYSRNVKSLEEVPDNATVAVVNDASNIELALKLLQDAGLIQLADEPIDTYYSMADVTENPKNISFVEVDYYSINAIVDDVDLIITDAYFQCLYPENADIYAEPLHTLVDENNTIGLVVRKEDQDEQWVKDLRDALASDETKEKFTELSNMTTVYWVE